MVRGRPRGVRASGAGGRGGRGRISTGSFSGAPSAGSSSLTNTHSSGRDHDDSDDLCGTCHFLVGDDAVGCDRCSSWFHSSSMCLGIPDALVSGIRQHGDAIAFICTDCRVGDRSVGRGDGAGGVGEAAFRQLFQTVKKLCETVQSLSEQMRGLVNCPTQQGGSLHSAPVEDSRLLIREEIREMEERRKRRLSVVIAGLDIPADGNLSVAFDPIARKLTGGPVPLSQIVCIDQDKKLYRAKVGSDEIKKKLLDNASSLAQSNFRNVYVNRDLTYVQRQELKRRRESRRLAQSRQSSAQLPQPVDDQDQALN